MADGAEVREGRGERGVDLDGTEVEHPCARAAVVGGRPDPDVLGAATTEGRILLTFDTDFADIRTYPLGTHADLVVFRLRDQRWRTLRPPFERLLADGVLDTIAGGLAIVEEDRRGGG